MGEATPPSLVARRVRRVTRPGAEGAPAPAVPVPPPAPPGGDAEISPEEGELELTGETLGVAAGPSLAEELAWGAGAGHLDVVEVLASALGVPLSALAAMSREEATCALRRLEALTRRVQRLEAEVSVDDLTRALRRRAGMVVLRREIQRARRSGDPLTVAFIDVDGLKAVNDSEGHGAGDEVLRAVAAALRGRLRSYDAVVRLGGDEFVAILPGADEGQAAAAVGDVAGTLASHPRHPRITVGLAALGPKDTAESLLARADAALYAARRRRPSGRAPRR